MRQKVISFLERVVEITIYVLICALPFSKAMVEICAAVIIGAWFIKKIISSKSQIIPSTILNWPIAFFVLFNILSVSLSVDPKLSLYALFSKVFEHILLFFIVVETIQRPSQIKRIFFLLGISAFIVSVDGLIQYFSGKDLFRSYPLHEEINVRACFKNPNDLAGWIIVCIPVFIGGIFNKVNVIYSKYQKIFFGIVSVLLVACLFLTDSRASWVGFLFGSIFFCYFSLRRLPFRRKIIIYFLFIVCLAVFSLMLPSSIKQRVMSITDAKANINRISLWKKSLIIIDNNKISGIGLNTYTQVSPFYYVPRARNEYPHNSYLHMTAEIGIPGLCAFLWMILVLFWQGTVLLWKRGDPLLIGLFSGLTSLLVHTFFDTDLYTLQLIIFFWCFIGIVISYMKLRPKEEASV